MMDKTMIDVIDKFHNLPKNSDKGSAAAKCDVSLTVCCVSFHLALTYFSDEWRRKVLKKFPSCRGHMDVVHISSIFDVYSHIPVKCVKHSITNHFGIPLNQQQLLFNSKPLVNYL